MAKVKKIRLCFHANISNYQVTIYDGKSSQNIIINNFEECINIRSDSSYLMIIAAPLSSIYNDTNIYFKLLINQKNCFDIYINFSKQLSIDEASNTFYLIDKNYGFPLTGVLIFKRMN